MQGRIDVARAGTHHQPLQRGHAQGGVDAAAVLDGGHGTAVAQVHGDQVALLERPAEQAGALTGHEPVRGAVEAVAPHPVLLVEFVGDGVEKGARRHGLVEGGVEHRHLGQVREDFHGHADAVQVGRVVQRRQRDVALQGLDHLRGDAHGAAEVLAPVHHPVADRADHGAVPKHALGRVGEQADGQFHARAVVRDGLFEHGFARFGAVRADGVLEPAHLLADALHQADGEHGFRGHVENLVLDRRTA